MSLLLLELVAFGGVCLVVVLVAALGFGFFWFLSMMKSAPGVAGPVRPVASLDLSPPTAGSDVFPWLPMNDRHPGLPKLSANTGWLGLFVDLKRIGSAAVVGVARIPASQELALGRLMVVYRHRTTREEVRVPMQWLGGLPPAATASVPFSRGYVQDPGLLLVPAAMRSDPRPPLPQLPATVDDDHSTAVARYFWLPRDQVPVPPSGEYVVLVDGAGGPWASNEVLHTLL